MAVIEYQNPKHILLRRRRLPGSIKAALVIAMAYVIGSFLGLGKSGGSILMVPVVWLAGGWYCAAREMESRASDGAKMVLGPAAVLAVLVSPFVLCHGLTEPPVVADILSRGWNSKVVSDGGRLGVLVVVGCCLVVGIVQPVDWLIRRRRRPSVAASDRAEDPAQLPVEGMGDWLLGIRWRVWGPIWLAVLLLMGVVRYGPRVRYEWQRHRELQQQVQAQAKCMVWAEPPEQVIYSDDPAIMASLPEQPYGSFCSGETIGTTWPAPQCWREFVLQGSPFCLEGPNATLVYLHRLTPADGPELLVSIGFIGYGADDLYQDGSPDRIICLYESAYRPGTGSASPMRMSIAQPGLWAWPQQLTRLEIRLRESDHITFFAGQPVVGDPAAFTIGYVLNGLRGTIDGRLAGGVVLLTPREGSKIDAYHWVFPGVPAGTITPKAGPSGTKPAGE